ncbi:MAG: hypothetical protein ACJ70Q_01905 [Nitrososphaera sp.]
MAGKNEQCWAGCGVTTLAARMIDTVQKREKIGKRLGAILQKTLARITTRILEY